MDRSLESRTRVSVLLTVYGRTEYLRECLAAALAQTDPSFEIWVLDDSNLPEIAEIVRSFSDPRILYRPNGSNLGVALSLRHTLSMVETPYVTVLNDDDRWEPIFLQRLMEPLESDPQRDLAFCDFWTMNAEGKIDPTQSAEYSKTYGRAELPAGDVADLEEFALVKNGLPIAMGSVIRRTALDPRELVGEVSGAYDFWIACLLAAHGKRGYFVKERLSRYRLHPAMESDRQAVDKHENLVFIYQQLLRRRLFPRHRLLLKQRLAIAHAMVASDAERFGDLPTARRHARARMRLQPAIGFGRLTRLVKRVFSVDRA